MAGPRTFNSESSQTYGRRLCAALASAWVLIAGAAVAHAQTPADVLRADLENGRAAAAIATLKPLAAGSDHARMALGFAEFTRAIERLVQGLHRYGLKTPQNPYLPVVRLPVPENPRPERIDYAKMRALYQAFLDDLKAAFTTLEEVKAGDAKVVLDLNAIQLRITEGADAPKLLALRDVIATIGGRRPAGSDTWEVAFDRADAWWLAGYAHMLSAMIEFVMAHDWQNTFEATAHLFFSGVAIPKDFAPPDMPGTPTLSGSMGGVADQIALLHLIHWQAGDRTRLGAARLHLKSAIALNRETWKSILAETDDDREWLPAPRQQNRAVPSLPITEDMVASWTAILDDFEAVLDGRKLLAHWRFNKGINLRKLFEDPKPFDLVLWVTGHGAMPFLEDGPLVGGTALQQWNTLFRGNFLGYAFFIN